MIAKMLTAGVVFAVANLAPFALSNAHAGHSVWSGYSAHGQRVQFRPWSHRARQAPAPRWRPSTSTTPRLARSLDRLGSPLISAAKARDPVVRAYVVTPSRSGRGRTGFGNRGHFRPDGRHVQQISGRAVQAPGRALHSQFRPAPKRRKPSYEQLLAAQTRTMASFPRYSAGYPVALLGRYAPYWNGR